MTLFAQSDTKFGNEFKFNYRLLCIFHYFTLLFQKIPKSLLISFLFI